MSVREADPTVAPGGGVVTGREVAIGKYTTVRRFLPDRTRRTIGAWCFVDHFGPEDLTRPSAGGRVGMWVPPHPHIGLQTVTWLYAGEVLHRDSVGSHQVIRPGGLNLMTSGRGIAHSEESVTGSVAAGATIMHGLQLWIALPAGPRDGDPRFEHHADLPARHAGGAVLTLVLGEWAGLRSPALVHTPLVGVDAQLHPGADVEVPLDPAFEHGLLVVAGEVEADGVRLGAGSLQYRPPGADGLQLRAGRRSTAFLLGGLPMTEPLVMWWNFVGPDHDTIAAARDDWAAGRRFGAVAGFDGDALPAPELPRVRLIPRGRDGSRSAGGA